MTTRRMMLAVAVLALILGGVVGMDELDRRADRFRKEADYHRSREERLTAEAAELESLARNPRMAAEVRSDAIQRARAYRTMARRHGRERNRCERVVVEPWLGVEPEPLASEP
jgi:hypothetical protein